MHACCFQSRFEHTQLKGCGLSTAVVMLLLTAVVKLLTAVVKQLRSNFASGPDKRERLRGERGCANMWVERHTSAYVSIRLGPTKFA
jgi:hypothetical protein